MSRRLSVSRVTVEVEAEPAYVAALADLAERLAQRGQSVWLFRHPVLSGTFLEFSESATAEQHRSRAARPADEAMLEDRLRSLATYSSDATVLWEEVPLPKRA
jgi:hypothetical protein